MIQMNKDKTNQAIGIVLNAELTEKIRKDKVLSGATYTHTVTAALYQYYKNRGL